MSRWGWGSRRGAGDGGRCDRETEYREFRVGRLPARVQIAFAKVGAPWRIAVDDAIAGGVEDPGALADLMFFLHHRERVAGGVGRSIDPKEDGFFLDTELNLALDAPPVVAGLRHRLWAHDLAVPVAAVARWQATDYVAQWDAVARDNDARPSDQRVGESVVPFDPVRARARASGLSG